MNAESPILPAGRMSPTPPRRHGLGNSFRSQLLSTPRSAAKPTARKARQMPRMSPSPRVPRTRVSSGTKLTASRFGDRFIPSRRSMNVNMSRRALFIDEPTSCTSPSKGTPRSEQKILYKKSLLSSLCDYPIESLDDDAKPKSLFRSTKESGYDGPKSRVRLEDPYSHSILGGSFLQQDPVNKVPQKQDSCRQGIPTKPTKILSLDDIVDDYYMHHLSWSEDNILAAAIQNEVYLCDDTSGNVHRLAIFEGNDNHVVSVAWCKSRSNSRYLAIGTNSQSTVEVWDTQTGQKLRSLHGHIAAVSSLAWNHQHCLTTGGRDSRIINHDVRCENSHISTYAAHQANISGLKWNEDGSSLASGGNDDLLCIWDSKMSSGRSQTVEPRLRLRGHTAAVKGIDWSPLRRGVLASGGGSRDRTIKIWNSQTGALLSSTDTGSQVSSVIWSKHRSELCSSHGYSDNSLMLWQHGKDSGLTKMADLRGHSSRILSTACSPDGCHVATAGADEALFFWNIFGQPVNERLNHKSSSVLGSVSLGLSLR